MNINLPSLTPVTGILVILVYFVFAAWMNRQVNRCPICGGEVVNDGYDGSECESCGHTFR